MATIEEGQVLQARTDDLPAAAHSRAVPEEDLLLIGKKEARLPERPREKLHPLLQRRVAIREGGQVLVVVAFRDTVGIPRFPEAATAEARASRTNVAADTRSREIVQEIEGRRAAQYGRLTQALNDRYGAEVLETFWLVNAALVRIPFSQLEDLALNEDVLYIEPAQTQDRPPQNPNANDDVDDGRARISSDPYFALNQTGGWIGLLDTGMRFSHTQFNNPSHIAFREDCTDGPCDGLPNPADDCWNHGTSSGAIITANGNQGNPYRGVTAITLDSFKVYPAGCGGLNTDAAVRAFERAVAVLDSVIVAEMQGGGDDRSSISLAADNAFDAGAVVIAANGNNGPAAATVNSPANAHKVIGVGNFDVQTLAQEVTQSRGPTADNRIKPDIQAPTNTETASNVSDTALRVFTGTSGATPYAAGAAALVRNFLRGTSASIDPGQVYAFLLLSGQQSYPFDNTTGAGRLVLPTSGTAWWGKVSVGAGSNVDVPLNIPPGTANTLDAALWWPETATQAHNDIDLRLIDPSGVTRTFSVSTPSVFERAQIAGPVSPGAWKLRIRGFSVPTAPQTVYWAAHVRR